MMNEQFIVAILQHLAWPLVALIAFFGLRRHVVDLVRATANIRELLGKGGEIVTLVDRLTDVKKELTDIKEVVDTIGIQNKDSRLQELARSADEPVLLSVDDMFDRIKNEWQAIRHAIRGLADGSGVKSNLQGTVNVTATVDRLVSTGAMTPGVAGAIKALSSQWERMWRTTSPKEEWLNQSVFDNFMRVAAQVREALGSR
jgi:hypothetical protein